MRGQMGWDGMGRDGVFLTLSFPYSKDGERRQELVTYALESGRRYREVHDVDRHAFFHFPKRGRTGQNTHTMDMMKDFAADSGRSPKQGWRL